MDVLSDVLGTVRLQGIVFASAELAAPWGMRAEPRPHYAFHVIARGHAWLEVDGQAPVHVSGGDVLVLSPGHGHSLKDSLDTPARPIEALLAEGVFSGQAEPHATPGSTHLICGLFRFDDLRGDVLAAALPAVIHTHELASDVGPWLAQTVKLLAHESVGGHPGSETIVSRLTDALFVYVVRSVLERLPADRTSWLRALVEPGIGDALRAMHEDARAPWTVATLAARAGMSRSAFAARFATVVGESPMQYLLRWRVQKGAALLREAGTGIAEVAGRVGYESDAAFNKAFKRAMGVTPGAYRRSISASGADAAPDTFMGGTAR